VQHFGSVTSRQETTQETVGKICISEFETIPDVKLHGVTEINTEIWWGNVLLRDRTVDQKMNGRRILIWIIGP